MLKNSSGGDTAELPCLETTDVWAVAQWEDSDARVVSSVCLAHSCLPIMSSLSVILIRVFGLLGNWWVQK